MSYAITQNDTVPLSMPSVAIVGDITPASWYKNISFDNGKPNLKAIVCLARIVYWYRPVEVRNENGSFMRFDKKYKGDLLQLSYKDFMNAFGFSRTEARNAIRSLANIGVISTDFRNIDTSNGHMSNVMFIDLNVDVLRQITSKVLSPVDESNNHQESLPHDTESKVIVIQESPPPLVDVSTYTEITTENTYKNNIYKQDPQNQEEIPESVENHRILKKRAGISDGDTNQDDPIQYTGDTTQMEKEVRKIVSNPRSWDIKSVATELLSSGIEVEDMDKFIVFWETSDSTKWLRGKPIWVNSITNYITDFKNYLSVPEEKRSIDYAEYTRLGCFFTPNSRSQEALQVKELFKSDKAYAHAWRTVFKDQRTCSTIDGSSPKVIESFKKAYQSYNE